MLIAKQPVHRDTAASSQTLTNPSPDSDHSGSFTVPSGVYSITAQIVGGGGGGGGESGGCTGGAGGGSGGYKTVVIPVLPFQVISYTIGKRGLSTYGYGTAGGNTTFAGNTSTGGGGGAPYSGAGGAAGSPSGQAGASGAGGAGGSCSGYGVGGYYTGTAYVAATGNGAGGVGCHGCYSYTKAGNCGDNLGCPGTPGVIYLSW